MRKAIVVSGIGVLAGSILLGSTSFQEPPPAKPNVCWIESKPIPNGTLNFVRCEEAKFG
jgi:hypothetical protein